SELRLGRLASAFRRAINGYDHQLHRTAFAVRFSSDDVPYAALGNYQLALDKSDRSVSQDILSGRYEPHLQKFYRERLKPGMVFVDVGANVGLYAILGGQLVGGQGRVVCLD